MVVLQLVIELFGQIKQKFTKQPRAPAPTDDDGEEEGIECRVLNAQGEEVYEDYEGVTYNVGPDNTIYSDEGEEIGTWTECGPTLFKDFDDRQRRVNAATRIQAMVRRASFRSRVNEEVIECQVLNAREDDDEKEKNDNTYRRHIKLRLHWPRDAVALRARNYSQDPVECRVLNYSGEEVDEDYVGWVYNVGPDNKIYSDEGEWVGTWIQPNRRSRGHPRSRKHVSNSGSYQGPKRGCKRWRLQFSRK